MRKSCGGLLLLSLMCCWFSGCGGSDNPADAKMEGTPPEAQKEAASKKFAPPGE